MFDRPNHEAHEALGEQKYQQYRPSSVLTNFPTVWVLNAHKVLSAWLLLTALTVLLLAVLPIDKGQPVPQVLYFIGVLYVVIFAFLALYGVHVMRRVRYFASAAMTQGALGDAQRNEGTDLGDRPAPNPCFARLAMPIRTAIGAALVSFIVSLSPAIVYDVFYTRMERVFRWSSGELCHDVQTVSRLSIHCSHVGLNLVNPIPKSRAPGGTKPLPAHIVEYRSGLMMAGVFTQWSTGELGVFSPCRADSVQPGDDFGEILLQMIITCEWYGRCDGLHERAEGYYFDLAPSVQACELFAGEAGASGVMLLDEPEGVFPRMIELQVIASRGPWIFRILDYLLYVSSVIVGAVAFGVQCVPTRVVTRSVMIAGSIVGGNFVIESAIAGTNPAVGLNARLYANIFVAVYLILLFVYLIVMLIPRVSVWFWRYAARGKRWAVSVGLLAQILSSFAAALVLWLFFEWSKNSACPGPKGFKNGLFGIDEWVTFYAPKGLGMLYPPGSFYEWLNFYLAQVLGGAALLLFFAVLCVTGPLMLRSQAEPR